MVKCDLLRGCLETAIERGLVQTPGYIDRGSADAMRLVIVDRERLLRKDSNNVRSEGVSLFQ